MKSLFAIMLLAFSASAVDLYVFSRNGTNVVSSPRELPSVGQPLNDPHTVVVLWSADDAGRAACGWYRYVACTDACPSGMVASNRWTEIVSPLAYGRVSWRPRPYKNFEISKYKLLCNLAATNAIEPFVSYLNADATRKLLWNAAATLDSTNAMVSAAAAEMSESLGAQTVSNLLWRSRVK